MAYQSLYRKYRSKNFNEIYGQEIPLKIIKNALKTGKTSHAYLFAGPRGTGKTSIAKIFARSINCESPSDGIQCEECICCQNSGLKECIDILEIDAASNNGVDEIRELRNKINLVPTVLKYKVYIIDEVHMLSTGAFNALLKTLEEPPQHSLFILATTEVNKVPPTILSRCQVLEFKKISNLDMKSRLKEISKLENIAINDNALDEIIKYADGALRDAIGILEKVALYTLDEVNEEDVRKINGNISKEQIEHLAKLILNKKGKEAIILINKYENSGVDLVKVTNDIIYYLRDEIFVNNNNNITEMTNIMEELTNTSEKLLSTHMPKILIETTIVKLCETKEKDRHFVREKEHEVEEKISDSIKIIKKEKERPILTENTEDPHYNLKRIRVNNTFVGAEKQYITEIRQKWHNLQNEAFNAEYGSTIRILHDDAMPVAASNDYLVLTFKIESLASQNNDNIEKIEKILKDILQTENKVVCLSEREWKEYTIEYKNSKENYKYIDEEERKKETIVPRKDTLTDKAKELFGDI